MKHRLWYRVVFLLYVFGIRFGRSQDVDPPAIDDDSPASTYKTTIESEMPYDSDVFKDILHSNKRHFSEWLLSNFELRKCEYPSYDGWYNNPWQPSLGSAGSGMIRLLPPDYDSDGTSIKENVSANPFDISDSFMNMSPEAAKDCENLRSSSKTGKNVLMAFFGQFVVEEMIYARKPACPLEYLNIEIPPDHNFSKIKLKDMPFTRTQYDKNSGLSPNNPRRQINSATAWIDGSVIYGASWSHANALRSFQDGQLASYQEDGYYPLFNDGYLSFMVPYLKQLKLSKKNTFRIGNPLGHENPFVLTFNILFFRWHNLLAKTFCERYPDSDDELCFNEARKWVIATLQHIIVDEWLPELIGEELPAYERYKPSIDPGISHAFQSAAMRFGQTLVPSAIYYRTSLNDCKFSHIRVCNSFYESKDFIVNNSIDSLLLGMALQPAEVEDPIAVSDIRRYLHGPPEFSSRDLMALNIQRGRDHGLPGYGIARNYMFPKEKFESYSFEEMATKVNPIYRDIVLNVLPQFYSSARDVDLWLGGLLETDVGPGPVFKAVIKEQFRRVRDGDRFWFENKENGLFTEEQVKRIKSITMYDVILEVTEKITTGDLQREVFHLPDNLDEVEYMHNTSTILDRLHCSDHLVEYECERNSYNVSCYGLPQLRELCMNSEELSSCNNEEPTTYDYFTGSGAMFILSFLFLFLFIIGCVLFLLSLVRRRQRRILMKIRSVKHQRSCHSDVSSHVVTEWVDRKDGTRQVVVNFNVNRKHIIVKHLSGQALRSIDMNNVQIVQLQVSTGANEAYILIHLSREYDLVLKFDSELERASFIENLETFLGEIGVGRQRHEVNLKHMLKAAVTKADRQVQLEKFFRVVFAQAFSIQHDQHEGLNLDSNQVREIINTELTPHEFADALSLRPDALFVQQMFALIDADGNGFISYREFLNMVVIFAKGSPDDKMKLLFDMYDIDHSGKLTRQEFSRMIKSLMELANQSLSHDQLDHLINLMFESASLRNKPEMTFDDFTLLLDSHREELGCSQLSFDIGEGYKTGPMGPAVKRQSVAMRARQTVVHAYSSMDGGRTFRQERGKSYIRVETKPPTFEATVTKQRVNKIIRFVENYHLHIFWLTLYTLIIFGIFIERAYYYSAESEHTGLRRIAGYGLTVTRGAASVMMFTFSTILLTMCRNVITFLRETFLHKYIPFDIAITFHKYIAFWGLMFTLMHAIGHGINFYHISTQTPASLECLFPDFHLNPERPPKFHYWLFETITGITGVFLVIILTLMYVFAVQYARRHVFNTFWATHNLYPILYILMILHGLGHLVQDPIFYYYFVGPVVLFTIDRLISISRKKTEISVVKADLLPSEVTHLEFRRPANFEYRSGQWVRIACVPLNSNEYHPFTLSSAPHEENLSLHIRAVGPWTANLRKIYDPINLQQHAYPKIYLDGPYGEGHQDWFRYDVSVLVGGGIGITPFASILKDIVFKSNVKAKISCKKLYFIWVTRTQKHFEWMTDIIREVEDSDKTGLVDVHIFITQFYEKFDLRTTMLYICERHFQRVSGRSLFTGLRSITHFGRPDFKVFFESLQQEHPDVNKIAVFSCGPPPMTHSVQLSCEELNKHEGAIFIHHFENF